MAAARPSMFWTSASTSLLVCSRSPRLRSSADKKPNAAGACRLQSAGRSARSTHPTKAESAPLQLPVGRSFQDLANQKSMLNACRCTAVLAGAARVRTTSTACGAQHALCCSTGSCQGRSFASNQKFAEASCRQGLLLSSDEKLQLYAYQKQAANTCDLQVL